MSSGPPGCRRRRSNPNRRCSAQSRSSNAPLQQGAVDRTAQGLRRRRRIGRERQSRDHRDAVGAGSDHLAGIARVDAGNGADRKAGHARTDRLHDGAQAGDADRRTGVVLGGRRIDATDGDVVEMLKRSGLGLLDGLDAQPDDGRAAEQQPRIGCRHVVLPDMHAVGFGGERHVDAVIDQQRHTGRRERRLQGARLLDHGARAAKLVAQLHQRGAGRYSAGKIGKRAAAGDGRIDDGIEAEIRVHYVTRARCTTVAPSSACRASSIATAKLPGPADFAAASSPATPKIVSAPAAARQPSVSTARQAVTKADAAHPIAVTFAISGWPLPIAAARVPSVTRSVSPDRASTMVLARAAAITVSRLACTPNSVENSKALSRTTDGPRAASSRAKSARPGARSTKTGSSTHGRSPSEAVSTAISVASRRSRSNVPRLTRRASLRETKSPISSAESVIDGTQPTASRALAVKFCATELVTQ